MRTPGNEEGAVEPNRGQLSEVQDEGVHNNWEHRPSAKPQHSG